MYSTPTNVPSAWLSALVVVAALLAIAQAAPAPDRSRPRTDKVIKLSVDKAVVHRPDHFTDREQLAALPDGVVVLAQVPAAAKELAAAFAAAHKQATCEVPAGKLVVLSTGPLLDGPDRVVVRSLTREGSRLKLEVVHTNVRRQGAQLRRNVPWRPMVQVPVDLAPGSYTLETTWRALESLPDGQPLEGKPLVVTREFKVAAGERKP